MRHAILGPGGVGGLVGALLAQSGEAVSLIVRPASVRHYPHVLVANSPSREYSGPVSVAATLTQPVDVLWITVKATELLPALASIPPTVDAGVVVPLLNGIDHLALLRGRFGDGMVMAATIAVESERIAPGQIAWRSPFAQLNLSSRGRARLAATVQLLSAFGWECRFIDDETSLMWSKLVFLAPLALSTTAAGAPVGEVLSRPPLSLELQQLVVEACAVAAASGAVVHSDQVLNRLQKVPAGMRSSMQKNLERGQMPELDAIAGPILRGGQTFGIPVPTTQRLGSANRKPDRTEGGTQTQPRLNVGADCNFCWARRGPSEATRDDAPAIDLIDRDHLCDLLKDLKLAVTTKMIEDASFEREWFGII